MNSVKGLHYSVFLTLPFCSEYVLIAEIRWAKKHACVEKIWYVIQNITVYYTVLMYSFKYKAQHKLKFLSTGGWELAGVPTFMMNI